MAAASIPTTSGIKTNPVRNKQYYNARHPTVEELLIQIEHHLYKSIEHRASLLIAVWSCLAGRIGYFRNMENIFHMLYRESAMTIFCGQWSKVNLLFKRGLSRALIHFSTAMGHYIKGAEGLCSALVMATYDPWGDPAIHKLLRKEDIDQQLVDDFIKSEPFELLVIRVECLVNARFEEAAIRLCRCCLKSHLFQRNSEDDDDGNVDNNWRWTFMEWLLRLLFRKGKLNDLVAESEACSCHDGVRLIYRTRSSQLEDSAPLTETLINLFLVRDLLFQSNYCCTSELMSLWCDFQIQKQRSCSEIQDAAQKLLVGHASSSAQFYLFVDILWRKFGASLLPLYIEMYVRGLTSDLNYLEAARQADNKEYVIEIENHMAAMYFKLSSMFNSINKEVSLECMLSSFSLDPTKERLDCIKRLSLQISKEKALKASASKTESCKHKLHNKTGCAYPHPTISKKKSVVMCDQAIQVGDELFEDDYDIQTPLNLSLHNSIDHTSGSCNISGNQASENSIPKQLEGDRPVDIVSKNENEIDALQHIEQNCYSNPCQKIENQIADSKSEKPQKLLSVDEQCCESKSSEQLPGEVNCINNEKREHLNSTELKDSEKCCNSDTVIKNFVPHNGEICDLSKECVKKDDVKYVDSKIANDIKENCDDEEQEQIAEIQNSLVHKECYKDAPLNNHVTENGFVSQSDTDSSTSTCKQKSMETCDSDTANKCNSDEPNNACMNGFNETKNLTEDNLQQNINGSNQNSQIIDNSDIKSNTSDFSSMNLVKSADCSIDKTFVEPLQETLENCSEITTSGTLTCEVAAKIDSNCKTNDKIIVAQEEPPPCSENNVNIEAQPFTHIVLDSDLPGVSEDLLSDFVIVLESLRNKQLKSSSKWSQIKHLCEDYLVHVSNSRCMMMNMQLNDSVDSEADSVSEVTAAAFKEFEFHQSDDSVVEDHGADKSHVFRRFMHADKNSEMATFVNLSDIHWPQIPLEKLFCTEHSSSHIAHKKRHKKHRNHDKNPEKVVLRKLRHNSRAEHDMVKRKKRKKRKAKRAKNHVKKHHSAHGNANKNYSKTKKKKHKLKKKKDERNSGFISGDYCSDFSSAELMRLVKEHSHSYSKLPATTSKHPHSAGSSSDEPVRKKRKVSFDKKKQKVGKYHDKHKHIKSKSSKRKKKLAAIQNCPETVKKLTDHAMHGKIDTVNDYSRIVQYSSVKKMEAVQIRQRSVALNLSEVAKATQEQESRNALVDPCSSNAHLQQIVQQNFAGSEDIMKMQLLMAQQQPGVIPISTNSTNFMSAASNQAVLKYVCSKMTSHLLSVAQSSNCAPSDSEGHKTPLPAHTVRNLPLHTSKMQPQNLTSNVKRIIIERSGVPYKVSTNSTSLAGTIIPVSSFSASTSQDPRNLMGTVFSGGITYPATATSPQMTTFTIPVAHNQPGTPKLVASKIVIPINQCGNIRNSTPTSISMPESENHCIASTSNATPMSSVIIVKNGNNTQIISSVQQSSSPVPCLTGSRFALPINRIRPNTVVTKTVPKMIKQAAKKLSHPVIRKPIIKPVFAPKPISPSNSEIHHDPVVAAALLSSKEPDIDRPEQTLTSTIDISKDEATDLSMAKTSLIDESSDETQISVEKPGAPSPTPEKAHIQEADISSVSSDKKEFDKAEIRKETPKSLPNSPKHICKSPVKDTVSSDTDTFSRQSPPLPLKDDKINSLEPTPDHDSSDKSGVKVEEPKPSPEEETKEKMGDTPAVSNEPEAIETEEKTIEISSETAVDIAKISSPIYPEDAEETEDVCPPSNETPKNDDSTNDDKNDDTSDDKNDEIQKDQVSLTLEENENLPQADKKTEVPVKKMSARRRSHSPIKSVSLSTGDQEKQLQPINDGESSNGKASPKASSQTKTEGTNQTSEAPTRSFTSISDAVRFSLMDMDDATDSVENQVVLQAFQASHASSPSSPAYAASESREDSNSASPSSAVMLSAPQSTSTTELNVSRVSQRFEPTVHSQTEKFSECQSTVSRNTSWIMEDTITEASPAVTVQKSPDIDSCGEGKDDDKPKKKRKKKERSDNDQTHKFWCQICSKGFFSAYNLRRHCRNVHKMDLPKGSSDSPFANTSQCLPHIQQADTTTSETSSSRLSYGNVQTSCVSPNKGSEYSLLSPSHEAKNQEFSVKSGQHVPQIQTAEFQMQTPPRLPSQSSSTHVSPVTPPKDFRHGTPTSVSNSQISPNKMSPVKSPSQSKFQRLPTGSQVPPMAKISQMQQIALCGQQAIQQQRQIGQLQSPGLIQPLPSVACQAQQMQTSQCPHFQANKQIVQQRIGQLQLMHHVAQLPTVPHAAHGIQKPTQSQSFKKCSTNQSTSKMSENEQMQQAAQIAQNQQILANQQMQKLIQIRQNAIAASGIASQLSLANALPNVPGSPVKGATQCFQSQLAAARQAAVVGQIPTAQRAQGTNYNLPSHDTSSHQFFPPTVQPSQDQSSCPHSSFSAQNMSEFSSSTPSYPTIRLSSEANDGLEDLEQFLLENMPWSGEQASAHGLAQQSGNRPSSADSLTLSIPSQTSATSQNRGAASKVKTSISRPKPRKPVATSCSKNLLGNLGRGVKKKPCPKKSAKTSESECTASKPEVYPQTNLVQQPHEVKTYNKDAMGAIPNFPKQPIKNSSVNVLNETDSSDSVQCINVTHNPPPKNLSVGINFNIFSPAGLCTSDKGSELLCNPPSCKEAYDGQRKNSFLDHSNLVPTSSSNLDQNKTSINLSQCQANPVNIGSAFNPTGKSSASTMKQFCPVGVTSPYGITNETPNPQDIFLGQRNSETSDPSNSSKKIESVPNNLNSTASLTSNASGTNIPETLEPPLENNLFLGGSTHSSVEKTERISEKKTDLKPISEDTAISEHSNSSSTIDHESKINSLTNDEKMSSEPIEKECVTVEISKDNFTTLEESTEEDTKEDSAIGKISFDNNNNDKSINIPVEDESLKENMTISPSTTDHVKTEVMNDASNTILNDSDEKSFLPKVIDHDKHSSHENRSPNDENHLPKNGIENLSNEVGLNGKALRVRKPQESSNKLIENEKVQYFTSEKEGTKNQVVKKNSKKKKVKQENIKNENIIASNIVYKLDSDSKIQKTGLLNNVNKEKDKNRSLCTITSCYDGLKKNNSVENGKNGGNFCLDEKQIEEATIDGIPSARSRLRDTPKTSVKRVCPCCVDSKLPKKCRANGGGSIAKIIETKVSNSLKSKSTLRTRNATNGHNAKVNTRSSQRLRSRNNAIS